MSRRGNVIGELIAGATAGYKLAKIKKVLGVGAITIKGGVGASGPLGLAVAGAVFLIASESVCSAFVPKKRYSWQRSRWRR